ncbi:hypothetical protein CLU79DRAFT_757815 [Phycomyces nitens]|nr:hypothetical protein CLU79DRAFT_757815 [Phycomyces nitens]
MGTIQALMDPHSPLNYQYTVNGSPFVESPETTCSEDSSSANCTAKQGPHTHPCLQTTALSSEATVAPMKTYIQPSGIWSLPHTPSVYPTEASAFWSCPTTPGNIWGQQDGEPTAVSKGHDMDEDSDAREDDDRDSDDDDYDEDEGDDPDYIDEDQDQKLLLCHSPKTLQIE